MAFGMEARGARGGGRKRTAVLGRSVRGSRRWRSCSSEQQVWVCAASRKSSKGKKSGEAHVDEVLQKCVDNIDEAARAVDAVARAMDSRVAKLEAKLEELTARLDVHDDVQQTTVDRAARLREAQAAAETAAPPASNGSQHRRKASSAKASSSSSSTTASAGRTSVAAANGRTYFGAGPTLVASAVRAADAGTVKLFDMETTPTRDSADDDFVAVGVDEDVVDVVADASHERPSHNGHTNEEAQQQEEERVARPASAAGTPPSSAKGSLPLVSRGSDDIEHVAMLHRLLAAQGFCVSDEEEEDFLFDESTEEALRTFQVCNGVEETGFVDDVTWNALRKTKREAEGESRQLSPPRDEHATLEWPALEYGCGGREVHLLQRALASHGFFSGDDDMQWWEFGDGTMSALKMFQASCQLPQTGTTSAATWEFLLGDAADNGIDAAEALGGPAMAEFERDLASIEGRVYLLGEDRFENAL